jgi:hypothetical protein
MPNLKNSNGIVLSHNIDDFKLDDELRDIKGFHYIELPDWVLYLLISGAIALITWLFYRYIKNRKKQKPLTCMELTFKKLGELDTGLSPKVFYLRYSEIVKSYFDERLKISTLDKTVEEMQDILSSEPHIETSQALTFMRMFNRADLAKFAREPIDVDQKLADIATTKEIINSIENKLSLELLNQAKEEI